MYFLDKLDDIHQTKYDNQLLGGRVILNNNNKNIQIKTKLINQGTYGCIFKPSFTCNTSPKLENNYLRKIQRKDDISKKEVDIGNKIKKIKNYSRYFAPVISSCKIHLAKIDLNEIKKCEFINSENKKEYYESNKIKNVGKYKLEDYIFYLFEQKDKYKNIDEQKNNKMKIKNIEVLFSLHIKILKSIQKLQDAGIVHFDLKENNIICNEKTGNPIIIDFGLSFDTNEIENNANITQQPQDATKNIDLLIDQYNKKNVFFTYSTDYDFWCIDICFMTYMFNELGNNWKDVIITDNDVNRVLKDFFIHDEKSIIKKIFISKPEYKENHSEYFKSFVGKKWKQLFEKLIDNKLKWDNYSINVIFIYILNDLELMNIPLLKNYIEYLIQFITSTPEKRVSTGEILSKITNIFSKNQEKLNIEKPNIKKMKMNVQYSRIFQLEKQEEIYKNINK
jgi:serine/threonine protein kinase